MRKFTFSFKSLLVACGLLAGSANVWGQVSTWTYSSTLASNTFGAEFDGSRTGVVKVQLGTSSEASSWKIFNTNNKNRGVCSGTNTRTFDPTNTAIPVTGTFMMVKPTKDVYFTVTVFNGGTKQQIKYADLATPTQSTTLNSGYNINANTEKEITVGKLLAGHTYYIYQNGTTDFAFKSFSATTYEDCTINYKYEGTLIKSEVLNNYIGQSVTATLASMWNDGADAKYFVADNATTSFTVAESGNNFDVALREANNAAVTTLNASVGGEVIKEGIQITYSDFSGTNVGWEGESTKVYYPAYILVGGKYYKATKNGDEPYYGVTTTYGATEDVVYTLDESIAYYSEVEDLTEAKLPGADFDGFRDNIKNTAADRFSGTTPRFYGDHYAYTEPLHNGVYSVSIYARNSRNQDGEPLGGNIKLRMPDGSLVDTGTAFPTWDKGQTGTKTATNISIPEGASLVIAAGSNNSNIYMDFIYLVRTGDYTVPVTISAAGYATFSSPYPLDLTTANTPAGLTAYYIAEGDLSKNNAPFTAINQTVAAGEGILLKGAANTYNIKIAASGTALSDNALVATNGSAIGVGNYVFAYETENPSTTAGFYYVSAATSPVAAGKAYLDGTKVPNDVKSFIFGDDTATGVDAPVAAEAEEDGIYYNLNGQQVTKDYKGIVIVNGKKFFNK